VDAGEEVGSQFIVTRRQPSEVFETAEHALDRVPALIQVRAKAALPFASYLGWDVRRGLLSFDDLAHQVSVIGAVGEDDATLRQIDEQRFCGPAVRRLAWRQQEGERAALPVGERVELGVAAAA